MTRPQGNGPNQQPWWARAGGAPHRGQPSIPGAPRQQPIWSHTQPPRQRPPTPSPDIAGRPKQSKRRFFIWVGIAIVAFEGAVLVVALAFFGYFGQSSVLDVRQAEAGVRQILTDPINGYGANTVTLVLCNNGRDPKVEPGKGFTCRVTVNGVQREVHVVFRDGAGTYEVDGPR